MTWERLNFRRAPVLTFVVVGVTAVVSVSQLTFARRLLADLERTPVGLHGDWWRTVTSLFVQDGGAGGALSNLLFLLALGALAEQVSRWRWIIGYFGAGLVGELAGYSWQPTGGGNSVANCGLAAVIVIAFLRQDARLPRFAPPIAALWVGLLLATWKSWGFVVAFVAFGVARIGTVRQLVWVRWGLLAFAIAVGIVLCVVKNIHGAAILAGLIIAAIPRPAPLPASNTE